MKVVITADLHWAHVDHDYPSYGPVCHLHCFGTECTTCKQPNHAVIENTVVDLLTRKVLSDRCIFMLK
jgi:hypothetical protein